MVERCFADANRVSRQTLANLCISILASVLTSGCIFTAHLQEGTPLDVYGFSYTNSSGSKIYETGLALRPLIGNRTFRAAMRDLAVKDVDIQSASLAWPEHGKCIKNLNLDWNDKSRSVSVRAEFPSPFRFKDEKATRAEHLRKWIDSCHCGTPSAEINSECFADRVADAIDRELKAEAGPSPSVWPALTTASRYLVQRKLGMPFGAFDVRYYRERMLTKQDNTDPYVGQLLQPGERLCFHSSARTPQWLSAGLNMVSSNEPGSPACFDWQTTARARYRESGNSTGLVSVGVDPLSRASNSWTESRAGTFGKSKMGGRYMASIDGITRPNDHSFRFAMVFARNEEFLIPKGPNRDLDIMADGGAKDDSDKEVHASSFILLTRDIRLMQYMRRKISDQNNACSNHGDTWQDVDVFREYLQCLVVEWGRTVNISIASGDVERWMLDVYLPSNVRPYVAFEVTVNGSPVTVRSGATLLSLIDQRLGLSSVVFELRSDGDTVGGATSSNMTDGEFVTESESKLIKETANRLRYERRAGLRPVSVGLGRVSRLEDLLIPLNPGDQVTWLD